jgi:2-C-methyl-D-erythritol 2,4-cyclodiphosphate synthase
MMRVGQGFDVHALVPGRRLVLGGVQIEYVVEGQPMGLLGHSDADVLLHAVTDAVLGAAGLGDIGRLYPDTDAAHKDADSWRLLHDAGQRARAAGWQVQNVDCTVIAQRPKIAPHVAAMCERIAAALAIDVAAVNVKGKTTEYLGFTGRGEGIAAMAVALLQKSE